MKLPLGRVAALMNAEGEFNREAVARGYSIDSRTVAQGELFVAIRGERLDGHDFVGAALARGAAAAVIEKECLPRFPDRANLLVVENTRTALQATAAGVRKLWGKPLIAVTGSAGKTTTKEIIARLLSRRYRVLKSEGNLNNHFGLPLQLLRLESDHDLAVLELGMSHAGEIAALAALAQPTLGAVTNVAPVHLGFFRSVAEIALAKKELIDLLPRSATAVLNADDEFVSQFGRDFSGRIISYGIRNPADVRAECIEERGLIGSTFDVVTGNDQHRARLPLLGKHNIYNALAAVAVVMQFGVGVADAVEQLAGLSAVDKRGQIIEVAGVTVINDCYNSNPRALDSMVDALAGTRPGPGGRRIVVAGEMLELGPAGEELHHRCGRHMAERGMDVLIGVRGAARHMVEAAREVTSKTHSSQMMVAAFVETPELAGEWLAQEARLGDVVLLKASRGVRLERALEVWRARVEPAIAAKTER